MDNEYGTAHVNDPQTELLALADLTSARLIGRLGALAGPKISI
jgi:hypothetical protein